MDKAIVVDRLSKNFVFKERGSGVKNTLTSLFSKETKTVQALKNISFTLQKGELVGFIGPNGAGKTTTMKVLSGLLYPDSGFVSVLESDPWKKSSEFLKQIALVMGQKNQLWWDLPVVETFEFNKEIYEISNRDYKNRLEELVSLLDVKDLLKTPVRKLSLGQRMKMELIASLLHRPSVLFLDEPTIGLDLMAQQSLREFIYEYNKKYESTILLSSHNMSDLVDLARRIIILNDGEIVFDGPLEEITVKFATEKIIKITLSSEVNIDHLKDIGTIRKNKFPQVHISVPRSTVAFAAAEILQNYPVIDLNIEELSVEEVIREVYKNKS